MPQLTQDTQFEQTFSDLAFSVIADKSPLVVDKILGFQVIDVNDDQTKSVGVFGAQIGEGLVYLPVFFLNGELKGTELMYIVDSDLFLPLTESWVQYITNQKPLELGGSYDGKDKGLTSGNSVLFDMADSPMSTKFASDRSYSYMIKKAHNNSLKSIKVWTLNNPHPEFSKFGSVLKRNGFKEKLSKKATETLLDHLKNNGIKYSKWALSSFQKNAKVCNDLFKFYTIDDLTSALIKKSDFLGKAAPKDVHIVSYKEKDKFDTDLLSSEEKKKLLKGELVVKDNRENTTKVYNITSDGSLISPSETGIYQLVQENGKPIKCFVSSEIIELKTKSGENCCGEPTSTYNDSYDKRNKSQDCIIVNLEGNGFCKKKNTEVCGRLVGSSFFGLRDDELQTIKLDDLKGDGLYVFMNSKGQVTKPVYVYSKSSNSSGETIYKVNMDAYDYSIEDYHRYKKNYSSFNPENDAATLIVTKDAYGDVFDLENTVYIPSNSWKAVKISYEVKTKELKDSSYDAVRVDTSMPRLASSKSIDYIIWKNNNLLPIKVYSTGTEYEITLGQGDDAVKTAGYLTKRAAINYLAKRIGIKGETAYEMVKQADVNSVKYKPTKFLLKLNEEFNKLNKQAAPYPYPAVESPDVAPNDYFGADAIGTPAMASTPSEEEIAGMTAMDSDLSGYNVNPLEDENLMELLNQAANTGQKEVFDVAAIGSLVSSNSSESLVDKYLGDLILGLDRIGRIYFLYLQHYEDFEDRYGQEDMMELEDSLKNTFETLGELIIFLKQKTSKPSVGDDRVQNEIGDFN